MDIAHLNTARSLYYQCLGELFCFSLSKERLKNLKAYLLLMQENLFDENLKDCFEFLLENLAKKDALKDFFDEFDLLFCSLESDIPTTFSYLEEGFENSKALLCVREILAKTKIRRNEQNFKEGEDNVGFCFLLMSDFLRQDEQKLAQELFEKVINPSIDEFLNLVENNKNSRLYKQLAKIGSAFITLERFCFKVEKPSQAKTKKVQNDLSRSEFLRRQTNQKRRAREKS